MDAFLSEQRSEDCDPTLFSDDQLVTLMLDVFFGGSETNSMALAWDCFFMVTYPEVRTYQ